MRYMLLTTLILSILLLPACQDGETTARDICVKGCRDAELQFDSYQHDLANPDCWCARQDGKLVRLW